jgi:hypothetical protein
LDARTTTARSRRAAPRSPPSSTRPSRPRGESGSLTPSTRDQARRYDGSTSQPGRSKGLA